MINKTHPRPGNFLRASLLLGVTMTFAQGETINQTVGNADWNGPIWGTPAAAPTAGNDYVSAPGVTSDQVVRLSANGASSTFLGDSLTVQSGIRVLMKNQNAAVATINGDLTLNGSRFSYAPNDGPHVGTLAVNNLIITGTGTFIEASSSVTNFNINGTLTGSGDLLVKAENGTNTKTISIANVSNYTGAMTVQATVRLDFGADLIFTNSLNLQSTSVLQVDQSLTFDFGKLVASGVQIPVGTYTGADITSLGANFADGGGTLTVILRDTDGDGLPDSYEDQIINFDPLDGIDGYDDVAGSNQSPTDFDNDGRTDAQEYADGIEFLQTDPTNPDTDGDGLMDGPEVFATNNEGVPTGFGLTNPNDPNSDDDRFDDGTEVRYGSNPNDGTEEPGVEVALVNGSFEEPAITAFSEAIAVSSGMIPGWSTVMNDYYVLDIFGFADAVNPPAAAQGAQFATADRRAPQPDVDPSAYTNGADATMSMRQEIDVSSLAGQIDAGVRTFMLFFAIYDNDTIDQGVVTLNFLDAAGTDLGKPSVFTSATFGNRWENVNLFGYPPVGTRKVRVTVEAIKVVANTTTVRNVHFDNFSARLVHFDFDNDLMPDPWELANGLNPIISTDAGTSLDTDSLTNLQEFQLGTNPNLPDTDGDGTDDDDEVANGTDPLDANSFPAALQVTNIITTRDGNGQVNLVEVVVSGLDVNKTYRLVRGTDLLSFPTIVDTRQPAAATASFFDSTPLSKEASSKAFYRLEE